jgi:DNA-binding Lrp family transcriptional regulator
MKETELKLICELIKNSRRSDRELAKLIGVSQPTVTRTRIRLEKEGLIDYTAIPNLTKLGVGIIALIFGKRNYQKAPESHRQEASDYVGRHPNMVFASDGNGLGFDRISISIHKDYSDYAEFFRELKTAWGAIVDMDSFLIDMNSKEIVQPLSLRGFANYLEKEARPTAPTT